MKKLFNLLTIILGFTVFTACSDDTVNPYDLETKVNVVSSNLTFSPAAGDGKVVFSATGAVTASANASWCTTRVSGDSVLVSVTPNTSREERSTQVVLHCDGDSTVIPVSQFGLVIDFEEASIVATTDAASSKKLSFLHNMDARLVSQPSWVNTTITSDSIKVDFQSNTTGHLRTGYVCYEIGELVDSIKVGQFDFDKDLAGDYYFCYTDDSGDISYFMSTLTNNKLTLNAFNLAIPITFDVNTMSLVINSCSYLGKYSTYFTYIAFVDKVGNYWTEFNTNYKSVGTFYYSEEEGATKSVFGGTFDTNDIGMFTIMASSKQDITEDSYSLLLIMPSPYIIKYNNSSSAKVPVSQYIKR